MSELTEFTSGPGEMMGNAGPGMLAGPAGDRDRRRARRIHRTAARRSRRRGGEDRAAGRQCDATHRPVPRGSARAGTLAVLLELQPQQEVGGARSARDAGARAHAASARRRGRSARCELRRAERGTGTGSRRAGRALPVAGDGAHDAVRRRWAVAGSQEFRPDPPRAWRDHDELRLRSRSEPGIRHAADRAADLARLPHRRRAACHRHHRGADPPPSQRAGAGRVGGGARGGVEEPRARHHALGDAARADMADDQPARGGGAEPFALASATPRTGGGSSRTAWARAT